MNLPAPLLFHCCRFLSWYFKTPNALLKKSRVPFVIHSERLTALVKCFEEITISTRSRQWVPVRSLLVLLFFSSCSWGRAANSGLHRFSSRPSPKSRWLCCSSLVVALVCHQRITPQPDSSKTTAVSLEQLEAVAGTKRPSHFWMTQKGCKPSSNKQRPAWKIQGWSHAKQN